MVVLILGWLMGMMWVFCGFIILNWLVLIMVLVGLQKLCSSVLNVVWNLLVILLGSGFLLMGICCNVCYWFIFGSDRNSLSRDGMKCIVVMFLLCNRVVRYLMLVSFLGCGIIICVLQVSVLKILVIEMLKLGEVICSSWLVLLMLYLFLNQMKYLVMGWCGIVIFLGNLVVLDVQMRQVVLFGCSGWI